MEYEKPKTKLYAGLVAITLVASSTMGFAGGYVANTLAADNSPTVNIAVPNGGVDENNITEISTLFSDDELTVTEIADKAADSVVEIFTEVTTRDAWYGQYVSEGAGSGVIISSDGYIITNDHVIDGASKISVRTTDNVTYEAELIGTDPQTDIAVVKITPTSTLTVAQLGDSDELEVGDLAVAIGNPLGELGGTVTEGIISALDREINIEGESMTLLQTSAAVNPGNSGGGLFDDEGNLVGIVNAKSSGTDIEGIGFAVPINTAQFVAEEIINNGYVSGRPEIGISLIDIYDSSTAQMYRVAEYGTYVAQLTREDIGLELGDRVISVDGSEITSSQDIKDALDAKEVGDSLLFEVQRGFETLEIPVSLQEKNNS